MWYAGCVLLAEPPEFPVPPLFLADGRPAHPAARCCGSQTRLQGMSNMGDRQQRLIAWMFFLGAACLVFCRLSSSASTSLARPATDALRMDTVLRACASFGGSITTCSGEFKVEVEDDRRGGRIMMPQGLTGTWAVSRERFQEESVAVYPGLSQEELAKLEAEMERASQVRAPTTRRRVVSFDGSRGIIQEYADGELGLNQPLNGGEAGPTALGACDFADWLGLPAVSGIERPSPPMPTSEDEPRIAGRESIAGVECIKILGGRPRGGWSYMWWTAPEYGYLVMRVDMVRYPPRDSVDAGQLVVMRRRVEEVQAFGKDVWLPTKVEKVTAKVRPDGSLVRVFRRERFTTANMSVNEPVDEGLWEMPEDRATAATQRCGPGSCRVE